MFNKNSYIDNIDYNISHDEKIRFETYFTYTKSISNYIVSKIELIDDFVDEIVSQKSFKIITKKNDANVAKVAKLLRNSWFTELQLRNLSTIKEYSDISLHWAQVYTYYATFLSIRAYFEAMNSNVSPKHTQTLKSIAEEIKKRPNLFPQPWKTLCVNKTKSNEFLYLNLNEQPHYIHQLAWSADQNYTDTYAKFLKTTRQKKLDKLYVEWKQKNKKSRISPTAKKHINNSLYPITIFDSLYRMRIRSNYENADTFIIDTISVDVAFEYHKSLQNIVYGSLFVFELLISKYLSKNAYKKIIENFNKEILSKNGNQNTEPMERWEIFKTKLT